MRAAADDLGAAPAQVALACVAQQSERLDAEALARLDPLGAQVVGACH